MPSNRKRITRLEQRLAEVERALAAPRDWATMPPAYDLPTVELPDTVAYDTGGYALVVDDEGWCGVYI